MPDSAEFENIGDISLLMRGAKNAIRSALSVTSKDVVTLICDEASLAVAASLYAAAKEVGAKTKAYIFERRIVRPATSLPPEVVRALRGSTVSIYTVHPIKGEFEHRRELINMVEPYNLRHAHMIDISADSMMQGMVADYREIYKLTKILEEKISQAKDIHVTGSNGTDIHVTLDPSEEIITSAGVINPGEWSNLPCGEVFTCPLSVDGVYYCDGLVPHDITVDRFNLARRPLKIDLADGRLAHMEGGPGDLAKNVLSAISSGTNMDKIGMLAVGTNFELLMPIGDRIQDLFIPGAYFSFGRPYSANDVAWSSSAQYIFTAKKTSLHLDGVTIIDNCRYTPEILALAQK